MSAWSWSTLAARPAAAAAGVLVALTGAPAVAGAAAAPTAGGCSATAQISSQWGTGSTGGEVLAATVVNTSMATSTTWTVNWVLGTGQRVVSAWNTALATSGTSAISVTAANLPYNGRLAPGGSTTFGVQLAGTGPAPTMTCATDAGATVTLTATDSQSSVTVHVGDTIVVELGSDYRPATVNGTALVQRSSSGGYPSGQPLLATYQAVAAGSVDLSTMTDYACLHDVFPCARPQMLWTVHVTVS